MINYITNYITEYLSAYQPQIENGFQSFVVVSLIFSALNVLFGYKLKKLWAVLLGVGIGFLGGFILGDSIWQSANAGLIAGIALAVIIGALAFFIYKVGIFILCTSSAFSFFYVLFGSIDNEALTLALSAVAALAVGVAAIIFLRPFIIITTAISGGFGFSQALFTLFPAAVDPGSTFLGLSWPVLAVGVLTAVIGIVVQLLTTKKRKN